MPEQIRPDASVAEAFLPFSEPVVRGTFLGRHKRFLVRALVGQDELLIHSNNTGSMLGLLRRGLPLLASTSPNPKRKLACTQEAVFLPEGSGGFWVGVNTSLPNRMLALAFARGLLPPAAGYTSLRREVRRGASRLDALLEGEGLPRLWVECKNVTMVEDEVACFPDACSERGRRHLAELTDIVRQGERAAMFYLVQRPDGHCFGPADVIDPDYARLFWQAVDAGVEMWPFRAHVTPQGVRFGEPLPLVRRPA